MLGDKVKELRKDKKITQEDLAKIIGLSQSTIGMLEKNKQGASRKTLVKLAEFFGVSVDYLISDDDNKDLSVEINDKKQVSLDTIPTEFTDPILARKYIDKHQIFGANGFDPDKLDDEEILEFANELLRQMEIVSYKFKK